MYSAFVIQYCDINIIVWDERTQIYYFHYYYNYNKTKFADILKSEFGIIIIQFGSKTIESCSKTIEFGSNTIESCSKTIESVSKTIEFLFSNIKLHYEINSQNNSFVYSSFSLV